MYRDVTTYLDQTNRVKDSTFKIQGVRHVDLILTSIGGEELRRLGFSAEWLRYVSQEMGNSMVSFQVVPGWGTICEIH